MNNDFRSRCDLFFSFLIRFVLENVCLVPLSSASIDLCTDRIKQCADKLPEDSKSIPPKLSYSCHNEAPRT